MATSATDPTTTTIDPPEDLDRALRAAGFVGSLQVCREDGAPLSDHDRKLLAAVLVGYDAAREMNLSDDEMADLAARHAPPEAKATGTDGE